MIKGKRQVMAKIGHVWFVVFPPCVNVTNRCDVSIQSGNLRASSPFGDIVKSTHARYPREETRKRGAGERKESLQ